MGQYATCRSLNECVTYQLTDRQSLLLLCVVTHEKKKNVMILATRLFATFIIVTFLLISSFISLSDELVGMSWISRLDVLILMSRMSWLSRYGDFVLWWRR